MGIFGVIGGSGFYDFPELERKKTVTVETKFGAIGDICRGFYCGKEVFFISRHGAQHAIPPHKINYRANIAALAQAGVTHVIAFNACGGITEKFAPGKIAVPRQIIDYTHGREHTFFDGFENELCHIDFSKPLSENLRSALIKSLWSGAEDDHLTGTYGCTQGPRLESEAEVMRLKNDGCDLVGMTMMPEASLAREKNLTYASLALVVNWAAGIEQADFSLSKVLARLDSLVPEIREVILKTIRFF